jgi:beta-lactamase regulating signal transducer with metallopeptidase domain
LLSWIIPFISFQIFIEPQQTIQPVYKVVEYFTFSTSSIKQSNNILEKNIAVNNSITYETIVIIGFALVSLFLLLKFLYGLFVMYKLKKTTSKHELDGINIYLTNEPNTPFSFLNNIFWNTNIDINSAIGKQVLEHELVHIKEKHSYDKIALQLCLIAGWFNPFFWIISKELGMIHEFIADKKSIPNANKALFAQMLLSTSFTGKSLSFTNPFFLSPIKRRLNMLTKNKLPKLSYAQRIFVLPIVALVVISFSLKAQGYSLKRVAANVINSFSNVSINENEINKEAPKNDTILIVKNIVQLQDTTNPNKESENLQVNTSATIEEMKEYKSYEKLAFTGAIDDSKRYDFKKLTDEQKLRMNELYLKMSFKQQVEVDLKANNWLAQRTKLKPTNELIAKWKKLKNYSFELDHVLIDTSQIKDASEYFAYHKSYRTYDPRNEDYCRITIEFTSKERGKGLARNQRFFWINEEALKTKNNKATKEDLSEILTIANNSNFNSEPGVYERWINDDKRLSVLLQKLNEAQKLKSPVQITKSLVRGQKDTTFHRDTHLENTFY